MIDVEAPMSGPVNVSLPGGADSAETGAGSLSRSISPAEKVSWALPGDGRVVTIGRSPTAVVCIAQDPQVSRLHAVLERIAGQWTLLDDGLSVNGTYLNGHRVSGRVRLHDRDTIRVGSALLLFRADPSAELPTVAGGLPPVRRLTEPQVRVLTALCRPGQGGSPTPATNAEICQELSLSLDAVKTHLRVLYVKFGVESLPQNRKRAQLVELTRQLGLLSAGTDRP